MSKFHINKNGVPSPCRAKPGNCPLGGDDTHFKTKQAAEEFVNKEQAGKHGILPAINKNIEISKEAYDKVFYDTWNIGGPIFVGRTLDDIRDQFGEVDGVIQDKLGQEVWKAIPREIFDLEKDNSYVALIKDDNLKNHIDYPLLSRREGDGEGYINMVHTVKQFAPEETLDEDEYYPEIIQGAFRDDLQSFIHEKMLAESKFSINGHKIHVEDEESIDRNWAKEYFESGRFDVFKKTK